MSYLAFILMVLHISACSIRCLLSPFSAISRRFVIRAGDDVLDLCCLLVALATLDALCWIMYVIVSLMVSMSSSYCSVSNTFLNSSWNSIFFDPIRVASTLGGLMVINVFLSTSTSRLMLLIAIQSQCWLSWWLLRMWRCLACLLGCNQLRPLGFSMSISSLIPSGKWYSWFCTFLLLPILPMCRLFRFSSRTQICPLPFP